MELILAAFCYIDLVVGVDVQPKAFENTVVVQFPAMTAAVCATCSSPFDLIILLHLHCQDPYIARPFLFITIIELGVVY